MIVLERALKNISPAEHDDEVRLGWMCDAYPC